MDSKEESKVRTWFNWRIWETLEVGTVSKEAVTVQQQVETANSKSVIVDSFGFYPSFPCEDKLDTETLHLQNHNAKHWSNEAGNRYIEAKVASIGNKN